MHVQPALHNPRFISPPALDTAAAVPIRAEPAPDPDLLAMVRPRFARWADLTPRARGRLIRAAGHACAQHLAGATVREIAQATGASASGVVKDIKLFRGE